VTLHFPTFPHLARCCALFSEQNSEIEHFLAIATPIAPRLRKMIFSGGGQSTARPDYFPSQHFGEPEWLRSHKSRNERNKCIDISGIIPESRKRPQLSRADAGATQEWSSPRYRTSRANTAVLKLS
jgi:hypothetical protein